MYTKNVREYRQVHPGVDGLSEGEEVIDPVQQVIDPVQQVIDPILHDYYEEMCRQVLQEIQLEESKTPLKTQVLQEKPEKTHPEESKTQVLQEKLEKTHPEESKTQVLQEKLEKTSLKALQETQVLQKTHPEESKTPLKTQVLQKTPEKTPALHKTAGLQETFHIKQYINKELDDCKWYMKNFEMHTKHLDKHTPKKYQEKEIGVQEQYEEIQELYSQYIDHDNILTANLSKIHTDISILIGKIMSIDKNSALMQQLEELIKIDESHDQNTVEKTLQSLKDLNQVKINNYFDKKANFLLEKVEVCIKKITKEEVYTLISEKSYIYKTSSTVSGFSGISEKSINRASSMVLVEEDNLKQLRNFLLYNTHDGTIDISIDSSKRNMIIRKIIDAILIQDTDLCNNDRDIIAKLLADQEQIELNLDIQTIASIFQTGLLESFETIMNNIHTNTGAILKIYELQQELEQKNIKFRDSIESSFDDNKIVEAILKSKELRLEAYKLKLQQEEKQFQKELQLKNYAKKQEILNEEIVQERRKSVHLLERKKSFNYDHIQPDLKCLYKIEEHYQLNSNNDTKLLVSNKYLKAYPMISKIESYKSSLEKNSTKQSALINNINIKFDDLSAALETTLQEMMSQKSDTKLLNNPLNILFNKINDDKKEYQTNPDKILKDIKALITISNQNKELYKSNQNKELYKLNNSLCKLLERYINNIQERNVITQEKEKQRISLLQQVNKKIMLLSSQQDNKIAKIKEINQEIVDNNKVVQQHDIEDSKLDKQINSLNKENLPIEMKELSKNKIDLKEHFILLRKQVSDQYAKLQIPLQFLSTTYKVKEIVKLDKLNKQLNILLETINVLYPESNVMTVKDIREHNDNIDNFKKEYHEKCKENIKYLTDRMQLQSKLLTLNQNLQKKMTMIDDKYHNKYLIHFLSLLIKDTKVYKGDVTLASLITWFNSQKYKFAQDQLEYDDKLLGSCQQQIAICSKFDSNNKSRALTVQESQTLEKVLDLGESLLESYTDKYIEIIGVYNKLDDLNTKLKNGIQKVRDSLGEEKLKRYVLFFRNLIRAYDDGDDIFLKLSDWFNKNSNYEWFKNIPSEKKTLGITKSASESFMYKFQLTYIESQTLQLLELGSSLIESYTKQYIKIISIKNKLVDLNAKLKKYQKEVCNSLGEKYQAGYVSYFKELLNKTAKEYIGTNCDEILFKLKNWWKINNNTEWFIQMESKKYLGVTREFKSPQSKTCIYNYDFKEIGSETVKILELGNSFIEAYTAQYIVRINIEKELRVLNAKLKKYQTDHTVLGKNRDYVECFSKLIQKLIWNNIDKISFNKDWLHSNYDSSWYNNMEPKKCLKIFEFRDYYKLQELVSRTQTSGTQTFKIFELGNLIIDSYTKEYLRINSKENPLLVSKLIPAKLDIKSDLLSSKNVLSSKDVLSEEKSNKLLGQLQQTRIQGHQVEELKTQEGQWTDISDLLQKSKSSQVYTSNIPQRKIDNIEIKEKTPQIEAIKFQQQERIVGANNDRDLIELNPQEEIGKTEHQPEERIVEGSNGRSKLMKRDPIDTVSKIDIAINLADQNRPDDADAVLLPISIVSSIKKASIDIALNNIIHKDIKANQNETLPLPAVAIPIPQIDNIETKEKGIQTDKIISLVIEPRSANQQEKIKLQSEERIVIEPRSANQQEKIKLQSEERIVSSKPTTVLETIKEKMIEIVTKTVNQVPTFIGTTIDTTKELIKKIITVEDIKESSKISKGIQTKSHAISIGSNPTIRYMMSTINIDIPEVQRNNVAIDKIPMSFTNTSIIESKMIEAIQNDRVQIITPKYNFNYAVLNLKEIVDKDIIVNTISTDQSMLTIVDKIIANITFSLDRNISVIEDTNKPYDPEYETSIDNNYNATKIVMNNGSGKTDKGDYARFKGARIKMRWNGYIPIENNSDRIVIEI